MRRSKLGLAALATLILGAHYKAHAACGTITSGMTTSQLQTAISACSSGQTAQFPAGTWSITAHINVPCGVSISGPVVSYSQSQYQTAVLNGSLTNDWGFYFAGGGCTSDQSFSYIQWNGGSPSGGGGGMVYIPNTGQSNMTFNNNTCTGLNAQGSSGVDLPSTSCIWFDGYASGTYPAAGTFSPIDSNVTISWNLFGSLTTLQCGAIMTLTNYHGSSYDSAGGYCGGVGMHTGMANTTITNNIFANVEQGMKSYESGSSGYYLTNQSPCTGPLVCDNNLVIQYNDFYSNHRIGHEEQHTPGQTVTFQYNDFRTWYHGSFGSWYISAPQYYAPVGGPYASNVNSNINDNVFVTDAACVTAPGDSDCYFPGIEWWSTGSMNYNLTQGQLLQYGNGNVPWSISNNVIQGSEIANEGENGFPSAPTQTGNTGGLSTPFSSLTSASPSISPAGGAVSSGTVVTIATTGTNRDTNTSNWCTTDGSTPAPGSGTSTIMTSYTVSSAVTLKCVGMWGAANQPHSYATNYGYVPSSVVSNSYTVGGVSLTSITASCSQTSFNPGGGTSCSAQCFYSNSTNDNCTSTDAQGNQASWSSSNTSVGTITSPGGSFSALTVGSTNVKAYVGAVNSSNQLMQVVAPAAAVNATGRRTNWIR